MYKRILLPIDLDQPSSWERALPQALELAKASDASLHVMTVVPDFGASAAMTARSCGAPSSTSVISRPTERGSPARAPSTSSATSTLGGSARSMASRRTARWCTPMPTSSWATRNG